MTRYILLGLIVILGIGSAGCSKVFWLGPEFSSADRDSLKMEKFRLDLRYARAEMTKAEYYRRRAPVTADLKQYYREQKENEGYMTYAYIMNGFSQGVSEYLSQQPTNCVVDVAQTYNAAAPLNCY